MDQRWTKYNDTPAPEEDEGGNTCFNPGRWDPKESQGSSSGCSEHDQNGLTCNTEGRDKDKKP